MISWIQKYFQRHFRLVFGIVLIAMAIPLVVIYSQSAGMGRATGRAAEKPFFTYNLGNEEFVNQAFADASRSLQLQGNFRADSSQVQQHAFNRLAGLALADRLHLPQPSEKEMGAYIAKLRLFHDEQGNFDQKRYSDFAAGLATNPQFSIADANRIFRDDARLEALGHVLGGPGYVLPADVKDILKHADTKWTVAVGTLDYNTFDAGVTVSEDALKKFFDENADRYEVGQRIKSSEVVFRADEFLPSGPMPEATVRSYYDSNPSRFPVPPEKDEKTGAPKIDASKPVNAAENFAKVKSQVEVAMRFEIASRAAAKAATDLTVALYQRKLTANSPELASFLAEQRHPAVALPPFSPENPPAELAWIANHADEVARLNKDRYFSDPLNSPMGAVVLLWNDTLPAYKPLLTEVHDKVAADYKDGEKRKRFVAQGQAIRTHLEAAIKAGTPFEKAAAAEKLEVKTYPAFTQAEPPKDAPSAALQSLASMNAGQVSAMVASEDKGYFVFVSQKQMPDLTPANARYAEINGRVAQYLSQSAEESILSGMTETELEKNAPATGTK